MTGYFLSTRGLDRFDLIHISRAFVAGRWMTLREIVRADIPASAIESDDQPLMSEDGHG